MKMKPLSYLAALFLLFLLFGCQDIFTYSPLDILQRDPASLSKDQQLLYAQQALSSGDDSPITSAIDIVENTLIPDDPANADLYLLLGDLKWTRSHTPFALQDYLFNNSNQFPAPANYLAFVTSIESGLSAAEITLLEEAADNCYYYAENTLGATLNAIQQLAAGIGLLSAGDPYGNAAAYLTNAINILVP
ncbi:MAG: hypothetical protein P8107_09195 [Spirochaetia bacterium]